MSNDFGCDTCGYARETEGDEVLSGTHYCKLKKEYIEYTGWMCDGWIPKEPDHDLEYHDKKCEEYNEEKEVSKNESKTNKETTAG